MTDRVRFILYTLILAALTLFTAACGVLPGGALQPKKGLVINEVVSSNKRCLTDPAVGSPDWIELYNGSDRDIDLTGYGLSDNVRKSYQFTFPSVTLGAGEYLLLYAAENNGKERTDVLCTGFGLSKNGDSLYLCNGFYEIVQELDVPALLTDTSYARRADGTYGFCGTPTPGEANTHEISDRPEELFLEQDLNALRITEVQPDGTGEPWLEITNLSDSGVRLDNYYISDVPTNLLRFQLPESTLEAGACVVVYLTGDTGADRFESSFKLGRQDTHVYLSTRQGVLVSELSWEADLPAGLTVVPAADGKSSAYTAFATPGARNSDRVFSSAVLTEMDAADPVRLSEALRVNKYSLVDADGDRSEWVELCNRGKKPVSLAGYYLSDRADDLFKWALPEEVLEPGAFRVVFLSGKDRRDGEWHASFRLSDAEDAVYLTNLDGMRRDALTLPVSLPDTVSVGRDPTGELRYYAQPTPGYENAYGYETAESLGFFNKEGVFISEVCAVNAAKSGKNDWIELHNGSEEAVDLTGWYLSDSDGEPLKYRLEAGKIEPNGYLVIEATSHPTRQKEGVAPFGISPAGETLVLSDGSGMRVDTFCTGVLADGLTSGRIEADAAIARVFFEKPTRGKKNSTSTAAGYAAAPVFSDTALYHDGAFTVTLQCAMPEAEIYYTLDGSEPTRRSRRYEDGIEIERNALVRAAAFAEGRLRSPIVTQTYLFGQAHTLPIVSLAADPNRLDEVFAATGRSSKVEREAYIQYFEPDGRLGVEFPCGIKAKGAGTLTYSQKSLAIHLRGGYGQTEVRYPFFPDSELNTFVSLVIRNGGQDSGDHTYDARLRDSFAARAVEGMHIDNALNRPVIAYINGKYYGIYDLGEDQNKDFLVNHYGVDGDAVDIIQRNKRVLQGSSRDIQRVFAYAVEKNLANDATFEKFCEWIDVDYFTDYFIAQTYFFNADMFNQKYWRSQDYAVKWRPIYYDLDFALDAVSNIRRDIIPSYFDEDGVPSNDGSLTHMNIYVGLNQNAGWRKKCAERYVELVCTQFKPERLIGILDELADQMRPEMERHIERWGHPRSMSAWEGALETLRGIIRERPKYALANMQRNFRISDAQMDEWLEKYGG